jgi:major membrane immunogen (membrane-anchored lipoprotein)
MKNKQIKNSHFKKFLGKWKTEGRILKTSKHPETKIKGTDSYELILDDRFILHKANVLMGKQRSQTYEIIGIGKSSKTFTMQHYDNSGASGFMSATFKNGKWNHLGEDLRFTGKFSKNEKEFSGLWERFSRKKWRDFIEIKLTKTPIIGFEFLQIV